MRVGTIRNFKSGTDLHVTDFYNPPRKMITIVSDSGDASITLDEKQIHQLKELLIFKEQ